MNERLTGPSPPPLPACPSTYHHHARPFSYLPPNTTTPTHPPPQKKYTKARAAWWSRRPRRGSRARPSPSRASSSPCRCGAPNSSGPWPGTRPACSRSCRAMLSSPWGAAWPAATSRGPRATGAGGRGGGGAGVGWLIDGDDGLSLSLSLSLCVRGCFVCVRGCVPPHIKSHHQNNSHHSASCGHACTHARLCKAQPSIPTHTQKHTQPTKHRQQLLSTQGSPHLRDNVVSVFGAAFAGTLGPIDVAVPSSSAMAEEGEEEGEGVEEAVTRITGFVSKVSFGGFGMQPARGARMNVCSMRRRRVEKTRHWGRQARTHALALWNDDDGGDHHQARTHSLCGMMMMLIIIMTINPIACPDGRGRGAERQRPAVLLPQPAPSGPPQAHAGGE